MRVSRTKESAKLPLRATEGSAGFDLYSLSGGTIPSNSQAIIPTGIIIELPKGTVGIIKSRSGWCVKHNLNAEAGVIDEDYRAPISVIIRNLGKVDFKYEPHTRLAQLLILPVIYPELEEVDSNYLTSTERGSGGFGSTGHK